jgi:tRNA (guanine-N(7)-)-methyltransferase subunit TRM82
MPKRPSSVAIATDGQSILCADKFGDVYAVPLLPSTSAVGEDDSSVQSTPITQRLVPKGANERTVHSKRNLKALEDQRKHRGAARDLPKEGPSFEHEHLLGHVSMLTTVATATASGKPYILTGDRDEHIRVSRGAPQAHVIETFCLGHEAFVNALCVPDFRPERLVSGGGDNELFLWDWLAGRLLAKVDLLTHVEKAVPGANRVAVTHLHSFSTKEGGYILALCER